MMESKELFRMSETEFSRWMEEEFGRPFGDKKECPSQQSRDFRNYPEQGASIYA